jgi:hypothetical protein
LFDFTRNLTQSSSNAATTLCECLFFILPGRMQKSRAFTRKSFCFNANVTPVAFEFLFCFGAGSSSAQSTRHGLICWKRMLN